MLLIRGAVIVIGLLIVLLVDDGIGAAVMALGCVPAVGRLVLIGVSVVAKREREDKPWA